MEGLFKKYKVFGRSLSERFQSLFEVVVLVLISPLLSLKPSTCTFNLIEMNLKESNRSRKTAGAAVAGSGGGVQMNSNNYITVLIILVILLACSIGMTIEIHTTSGARESTTYF